jgi:hypothetical protein
VTVPLLFLSPLLAVAVSAAGPGETSVLAQCDAFLAAAAARTPAYRADIRPAEPGAEAAPGRRTAVGPLAGGFTYRPKTYRELTAAERTAVWRDPAWAAFLRAGRDEPAAGTAGAASREHPYRVEIRPAEMLRSRPGSIALPP